MNVAAAFALLLAPGALAATLVSDPITGPCFCPAIYDPVCGSDGKTYSNECQIKCTPGVTLKSEGPCPIKDDCCSDGFFCCDTACLKDGTATLVACGESKCCKPDPPPPTCCPADAPVCQCGGCHTEETAKLLGCPSIQGETCCPEACPKNLDPVCGANGKDYGNDCLAKQDGVEVACKGTCPCDKPADNCCPRDKPACICGGCGEPLPPGVAVLCAADAPRTCCEEVCNDEWAPVCGVDGKTYGNECEAKGTEIKCKGKCPCKPAGDCCGPKRVCCGHKCISKWLAARSFCAKAQCCKAED